LSTVLFQTRPVRRHRGSRFARWFSVALIAAGLLVLADAAVTLLWQEPVTAILGVVERGQIDHRWLSYSSAPLSPTQRRILGSIAGQQERIAFLARREERGLRPGEAAGRITIPSLGANFLFVQGTDAASLEKGPGHYPSTALPGLGRTVAIAGHRTTFLAPFRHLDALHRGDRIVLTMPYGRFVYVVQFRRIVDPTAWWVTRSVGYDRLVLSACDPLFSAAHRLVIFARLRSGV
jgi:sortase A